MEHGRGIAEALRMLETFASVGVARFDLTHINISGEKRGFRAAQTHRQLRTSIPYLLESSVKRQNSVIVRPHQPEGVAIIQLDDLGADHLVHVAPVSFLALRTSPGNYQAWVAVRACDDAKDLARRLRKGAHADPTASGATRVAGTANYKPKYAPAFPIVAIEGARSGHNVTPEELDTLGLLAPPDPARVHSRPLRASGHGRTWPSYERCLQGAPMAHNSDKPDVSRADFTWCMIAIDWQFPVEDVTARLMEESTKAKENGERYATATAQNAAAAVQARRRAR
jgi:hypothetical protein